MDSGHNVAEFERYKQQLIREERMSPAESMSGTVVFKRPVAGASDDQVQQIRDYCAVCTLSVLEGYMSPTGRVSTKGDVQRQAGRAAAAERRRAEAAGVPYGDKVAGHGPDTTWTNRPDPPYWLYLDDSINSSLGRQALDYPVGFKPTRFLFEDDL